MRSETPGTPGRRQQMPRTMRSMSTAGARGPVQRLDDGGLGEGVELGDDAGRPAGPRMDALPFDLVQQRLVQAEGRNAAVCAGAARASAPSIAGISRECLRRSIRRPSSIRSRCRAVRSWCDSCPCPGGSSAAVPFSSRRTTITSLACVLKPKTPYMTWAPASCSWVASSILASSSKRARSSMMTVTSLPACAASASAPTMVESLPARYRVCLMAST